MKLNHLLIIISVIALFSCVGPPDPQHGFVENFPVVVSADSVFTYTLRGDDYSFEDDYILSFDLNENMIVSTVLIVADYSGSSSDTSRIWLLNDQDIVQQSWLINRNQIQVENRQVDSVYFFPTKVMISGNHFSGVLEFVLKTQSISEELEENVPSVINTNSVFSFSLDANLFSFDRFYRLGFVLHNDDTLVTNITMSEWVDLGEDTTFVTLFSADTTELQNYPVNENVHITDEILISDDNSPEFIRVQGQNLSGILDILITRK